MCKARFLNSSRWTWTLRLQLLEPLGLGNMTTTDLWTHYWVVASMAVTLLPETFRWVRGRCVQAPWRDRWSRCLWQPPPDCALFDSRLLRRWSKDHCGSPRPASALSRTATWRAHQWTMTYILRSLHQQVNNSWSLNEFKDELKREINRARLCDRPELCSDHVGSPQYQQYTLLQQ